ncbi:hypothetical protein FRC11_005317 [Ceratobasidium sp. 423]|nr:hypothetical protein FRC11_005317 [Ceratobasidium sp. 423]
MDMAKLYKEHKEALSTTKPHEEWARDHLSKGRAVGSRDADLVWHTLHHAIPAWVVHHLDKKDAYTDFGALCKDIGKIPSVVLYGAYKQLEDWENMDRKMNQLTITAETTRVPSTRPTTNPTSSTTRAPRQPQVSFAATTTTAPATRDRPPHFDRAPAPATPSKFPPLVAEPTAAEHARHKGLVAEFRAKHGNTRPSLECKYPLSPGTYEQDANLLTPPHMEGAPKSTLPNWVKTPIIK